MYKDKYLKYKSKYLNLKGSSINLEKCLTCYKTKEQVKNELDNIISQLPEGCIKYTFISDILENEFIKYKEHYGIGGNKYDLTDPKLEEKYHEFLAKSFFSDKSIEKLGLKSQFREIIINYQDLAKNSSSTMWHQDTKGPPASMYNILYYLELENCRLDCGTEIAFKNSDSKIIFFKLPIIKGLILALKDDCFAHKSPIVTLIDPEKIGTRLLLRTYTKFMISDASLKKNNEINKFATELNKTKLKECLETYFNNKIDSKALEINPKALEINPKALEIDCKQFIRYAYLQNNEHYNNIIEPYEAGKNNAEFFNELRSAIYY